MRLDEIGRMVQSYFAIAAAGVALLIAIVCLVYFIFYKKIFKGKKSLSLIRSLEITIFAGYILMVLAATILSREAFRQEEAMVSLSIFEHYLEAWNGADLRAWQMIIFNILMFVPFGVFLPVLWNRFRKPLLTLGLGLAFTAFIEILQLITRMGVFETADILNNWIGTLLGYCLAMLIIVFNENRKLGKAYSLKVTLCLAMPIILVLGCFGMGYAVYNFKEFGNMSFAPSKTIQCKGANFTSEVELSDREREVMVYRTKAYTKETGLKHVKNLFNNFGDEINELDISQYNDNALYGNKTCSIWLEYKSGTYLYRNYNKFHSDSNIEIVRLNEEEALDLLKAKGITLPEDVVYEMNERGSFTFTVKPKVGAARYDSGSVTVEVSKEGDLLGVDYDIISTEAYRNVKIKSIFEASKQIKNGKFQSYDFNDVEIDTIQIKNVVLQHYLDTKGFLQPVYNFTCLLNGEIREVLIPALK